MALNNAAVRVAVTGVVSKGLTSATAPTSTSSTLTGFTDLGWVNEDGVTISLPDAGDATPLKGWQNGATIRIIRTASDENPTYELTFLESKLEVVEAYFGTTVTQTATEGSFSINTSAIRGYNSYVFDVVDGAQLIRDYIPRGTVTSVGEQVFANGEPIGYQVTIEAEFDSVKGYNVKRFDTDLKTP